ncbi:dihydropteroate synthase [Microcoleus sp. FACHB-1515]|uniref:dihydropteroate synthase n=1 Tax=Cyanophyceae TaxID=3028117 RepID=UPI001686CF99|nr:dihydropteroate synthase [Microcoleus sp. FACHB-1515]MBD2088843.1 dihydropteroate synthase [Microcoleus sp. FACHB-1515]
MGVLNVTPDSFSDGGLYNAPAAALEQAQELVATGADILDVGGQSTRPQADTITAEEEQQRVLPVIAAIRSAGIIVPISIDTTRASVARAAIEAGANWVNDVSGGTYDSDMLPTVAQLKVPIVLMHSRGTPKTMQQMTEYRDLIGELREFLQERVEAAIAAGIDPAQIAIDPGIGFAKTGSQNLEILRRLPDLRFGHPLLVGTSRKSFIGHILNQPDPKKRVWGTAATCCAAIAGGADVLRVHDVRELREVCLVADAIWRGDR